MEQTSENLVKKGQIITVKNADGDADTTATIMIKNKIINQNFSIISIISM